MSQPPLLHTNVHETEIRGGGKTSAGKERMVANRHDHYTPDELAKYLHELVDRGYYLTIEVLATRDKRSPQWALYHEQRMIPRCHRHNCPEYAAAQDRLSDREQQP